MGTNTQDPLPRAGTGLSSFQLDLSASHANQMKMSGQALEPRLPSSLLGAIGRWVQTPRISKAGAYLLHTLRPSTRARQETGSPGPSVPGGCIRAWAAPTCPHPSCTQHRRTFQNITPIPSSSHSEPSTGLLWLRPALPSFPYLASSGISDFL